MLGHPAHPWVSAAPWESVVESIHGRLTRVAWDVVWDGIIHFMVLEIAVFIIIALFHLL